MARAPTLCLPSPVMIGVAVLAVLVLAGALSIQYRIWLSPLPESLAEIVAATEFEFTQPSLFGAGLRRLVPVGGTKSAETGADSSTTPLMPGIYNEIFPPFTV